MPCQCATAVIRQGLSIRGAARSRQQFRRFGGGVIIAIGAQGAFVLQRALQPGALNLLFCAPKAWRIFDIGITVVMWLVALPLLICAGSLVSP